MQPRTLASLAHALSVAPDQDTTLVALGEALMELDRGAVFAVLRYDARRDLLDEVSVATGQVVRRQRIDTTFDHLPPAVQPAVRAGGQFVDLGDKTPDYARLFDLPPVADGVSLSLRGLHVDGHLAAVVALLESRKIFGARTAERFGAATALFELAYGRLVEREGREEAGRTLEGVMQRVHAEYERRLAEVGHQLSRARSEAELGGGRDTTRILELERETSRQTEELRRATTRVSKVEQQVTAAVGQLEQAHVELHRRSEQLRQKTRTLYLLDRMLTLDGSADDPRRLADGLLNLAGEDMQAQRCSLMLLEPGTDTLVIAAVRGVAPNVALGERVTVGQGVAGRVAASREPLLVQDVSDAAAHPLLRDQFFTTGSFISCPLVYRDALVGVLNLTNRARFGVFVEEDVERVRLLALVTALICVNSRLSERLIPALGVH
jgi:putative methionine-R-sulfoxide reductase with GAF domain